VIVFPALVSIANQEAYAAVGFTQVPKYRSGGTDTLARTGVIVGTPLFVAPPMSAAPRAQTIVFS